MAGFIPWLIGTLVGAALGALLGALLLQLFTSAVAKFKPTYKVAYIVSLIGGLINGSLGSAVAFIVTATGNDMTLAVYGVLLVVGFLLYSWMLGVLLKHPDTGAIGFKTGFLINLAYLAAFLAVGLAGAALVAFVTK
jgi:hypothetical protein